MKRPFGALPAILAFVVLLTIPSLAGAAGPTFRAQLSGSQEVPARQTLARGQAVFLVADGGDALQFKLTVAKITNVFAAHIHCGAVGVNGPVGVTLFMGTPGGGAVNGPLASGTITAPDAGNACGWSDMAAVIAAMESGNTYVNVHTDDGVAPTNAGPGDFPGGEIRGQIR